MAALSWEAGVAKYSPEVNDFAMDKPTSRSALAGYVTVAHAIGLWTAGMAGSIGTTAGFSVAAGGLGLFLGGILSLPWIAALAAVIWFYGGWIERHPFLFALIGPAIVCGTYALLGGAWLDAVAISSITSSACYLLLILIKRYRLAAIEKT